MATQLNIDPMFTMNAGRLIRCSGKTLAALRGALPSQANSMARSDLTSLLFLRECVPAVQTIQCGLWNLLQQTPAKPKQPATANGKQMWVSLYFLPLRAEVDSGYAWPRNMQRGCCTWVGCGFHTCSNYIKKYWPAGVSGRAQPHKKHDGTCMISLRHHRVARDRLLYQGWSNNLRHTCPEGTVTSTRSQPWVPAVPKAFSDHVSCQWSTLLISTLV